MKNNSKSKEWFVNRDHWCQTLSIIDLVIRLGQWHKYAFYFLHQGDFNVIVVDWAHGANTGYQQAVANTYLVGAEVTYLLEYLRDNIGLKPADVHIIGHSLGAQIAGHTGHAFPGLGRISGQ